MKKITQLVVALVFLIGFTATAQQKMGAGVTGTLSAPISVPSIAEQMANKTIVFADNTPKMGHAKGRGMNQVVPGKGSKGNDPLVDLQRNAVTTQGRAPLLTFVADISSATPSDPTGAAGPDHYVAAWNSAFRIFDKAGNPLTAELALGTLFPGNNIGDPIVFFDANIDNGEGLPRGRFVITEFDNNPNGFNVAVCQGPDPVNDGWHVYTTGFGTGSFPDYTKFSVWGDSYIVTANISASNRVFAVERNQMINGDAAQFVGFPLPGIATSGFYSPQGFHTTADETVPAGTPAPIVYLQDDAWGGVSDDHLKIWEATIDWANPANHSIELAQEVITEDFVSVFDGGSFSNIPQGGGTDQDALQATMMNQVQYRRFADHNSVVMNFVVDVLDPGEKAGVRWYELRQTADNEDWTIYQEGTYEAPDNRSAYSGSMVMNDVGDIAMTYTSSSETDRISINYTGRFADDALNVMTVAEQLIAQSTAANPSNRLADYTQTTIDPVDGSYWNISEYFEPSRRDVVCNFVIDPAEPNDIGVASIDSPTNGVLTDAEDITISITNYGSNDITNPMVQYSVDGVDAPAEMFTGTIAAATTESFTFTTQADLGVEGQTYVIVATTLLPDDSNTANDSATVSVNNGVELCEPVSDCAGFNDGVTEFALVDQDISVNCGPTGYSDDRDIVFTFDPDLSSFDGVLQMGFSDSIFALWIDVNDDGTFSPDEVVATEQVATADSDFAFTVDVSGFTPEELLGSHTMRLRGEDESTAGDVLDPCGDLAFGRTNDFTAFFDPALSTDETVLQDSAFNISSTDNKNFNINVNTSFEGRGAIAVYNLVGQQIVFNNLEKQGNGFNYNLNMSYAASGVYLVKFLDIDGDAGLVKKIIVK